MKLLLDQNLSCKLCLRLADLFPGTDQVYRLGLDRADDRAIWQFAKTGGLTIVTRDPDFADMAMLLGPPPKVIWLRCGNPTSGVIEKSLRDHAEAIDAFEQDGTVSCCEIY